jgi:hypothetical protein
MTAHFQLLKTSLLICLTLIVFGTHAAFQNDSVEDLRVEALAIHRANKTLQEDRILQHEALLKSLRTASDSEVTRLYLQFSGEKKPSCPIAEQKALLGKMCEEAINVGNRNLMSIADAEQELTGEKKNIQDGFSEMLGLIPDLLERRKNPAIPSTIPDWEINPSSHRQNLMEQSRIQRFNELAILKIFAQAFSPEELNDQFKDLLLHREFGGYFTVLKAYTLDLIESPPLPDHFQLALTKQQKTNTTQERLQKKQKLQGPLKPLEELESQAITALDAYTQGLLKPGQWAMSAQTMLAEKAKKAQKNRARKNRQKEAKLKSKEKGNENVPAEE